ncbi:hypothetical protein Tco_1275960 [Tanacetum coccineum]
MSMALFIQSRDPVSTCQRDDDDDDSSGDDADDKDEDKEDGEEEEHLAPADYAIIVPIIELVSPPKGTEPVIPPPSTDITTTGARITVRLQASISLPPEAEVERLLAMPTPPPSPPISLSPPSVGERLARCTTPSAHSSPPHVPSPLLPSSGDAVPILQRSRGRLWVSQHLSAEERRRGIREVGYGIRDTWVDPAEAVPEIAPMTLGEVNTRVTELAELHEHDTHDLYALLEDAQEVHFELQTHREQVYVHESQLHAHQTQLQLQGTLIQTQHQVHETRSQMQQTEMAELRETGRRRQAQMIETLLVMRDMRWIKKMESVFNISGCAIENHVKFATCTLLGAALTWWNGQIRTLGPDAYSMTWEVPQEEDDGYVMSAG